MLADLKVSPLACKLCITDQNIMQKGDPIQLNVEY